MRRWLAPVALVGLAATGCGASTGSAAAEATPGHLLQLSQEQVVRATLRHLSTGPTVSGELTAAREATVRAQVGGAIVSLPVDRGAQVRAGTVLARIASRDLDDGLSSAKATLRSAETALTVATAELQRTESLVRGGALATRELEQARAAVANAEAQLAAAKARETSVVQQLSDTTLRAPFAGIVSDRTASVGDVVTPGTPIVTIIDPSSLSLEALVPSDQIGSVRPGVVVRFQIRGFPDQVFTGAVDRISPTADQVTRQVAIFVALPNLEGKLISGLFAEGRVESASRAGIVVPLAAVDETGATPTVTRIRNGLAERAPVKLGLREPEEEMVEILAGVASGDLLVKGSAKRVAPGTPVKVIG